MESGWPESRQAGSPKTRGGGGLSEGLIAGGSGLRAVPLPLIGF